MNWSSSQEGHEQFREVTSDALSILEPIRIRVFATVVQSDRQRLSIVILLVPYHCIVLPVHPEISTWRTVSSSPIPSHQVGSPSHVSTRGESLLHWKDNPVRRIVKPSRVNFGEFTCNPDCAAFSVKNVCASPLDLSCSELLHHRIKDSCYLPKV